MLRILVISLFVANLLLLGFQRDRPEARPETNVAPVVKKNTGIPTIHLFSEMIEDQGLLSGNRQCFSLGPFHSSEDKDEVLLLLQEVSTRVSERQTEALVEKGYWVFMSPYGSLLEANQALISLQALGLEDIGIIYDGDWKNAISLGYFMRQENAQRRKKSVESKGYAPMIRVQRQGEPRYWLDYEQPPGSDLVVLDMQNRQNDFMQRALPCPEQENVEPGIASPEESVQVIAQLQEPGTDNQTGADPDEEAGDQGVDGAVQEVVETLPNPAVEPIDQEIVDTGTDNATETETEGAEETGTDNAVDTEPEGGDETETDNAVDTEPQGGDETGSEDTVDTEPESANETGSDDSVDTEPEGADETGSEDVVDTEPESANETGSDDSVDTEPEGANETGSEDIIDTEPGDADNTGLENASETGEEEVIDSVLESAVEPEPANTVEAAPANAVGTGPPDAIGMETEEPSDAGSGEG